MPRGCAHQSSVDGGARRWHGGGSCRANETRCRVGGRHSLRGRDSCRPGTAQGYRGPGQAAGRGRARPTLRRLLQISGSAVGPSNCCYESRLGKVTGANERRQTLHEGAGLPTRMGRSLALWGEHRALSDRMKQHKLLWVQRPSLGVAGKGPAEPRRQDGPAAGGNCGPWASITALTSRACSSFYMCSP